MDQHHTETHAHPGPRQYVIIGIILAILTALEVIFFETMDGMTPALGVWAILLLSLGKFALVIGYFMHLKFDDWRFRALFISPLIIMATIMVALMAMMGTLTR